MNSHPCPVAGCTRSTPAAYLMCRVHWSQAPKPLQRAVYRSFHAYHCTYPTITLRGIRSPNPAYSQARKDYLRACEEAIDSIREDQPCAIR